MLAIFLIPLIVYGASTAIKPSQSSLLKLVLEIMNSFKVGWVVLVHDHQERYCIPRH